MQLCLTKLGSWKYYPINKVNYHKLIARKCVSQKFCPGPGGVVDPVKKLEAAHHRWQRSILGISWKDKVTNKWESQRGNCTSKAGRRYQMQTSEMAWTSFTNGSPFTIDFRDKLSYGKPRVSGGGQVTATELEWCQKRSQENGHQLGRGWRGCRGQEELEESCRPMRLWRGMNQEPGNPDPQFSIAYTTSVGLRWRLRIVYWRALTVLSVFQAENCEVLNSLPVRIS